MTKKGFQLDANTAGSPSVSVAGIINLIMQEFEDKKKCANK